MFLTNFKGVQGDSGSPGGPGKPGTKGAVGEQGRPGQVGDPGQLHTKSYSSFILRNDFLKRFLSS